LLSPAVACYTACIALKPDYDGWYSSRGAVYLKQKEYQPAAADFDEALRLRRVQEDGQAEVHVNRAIARLGVGRPRDAIDDLSTALASGGEKVRLHLLLARAWDQLGNSDAARRERQRSAELPPGDEAAWVARAFARAASDPAAALEDDNRALQLNACYLPAWESKVHLLAERLDRPDEAVAVLDQAIALYPEAASLVAARGVLRARQSNAAGAQSKAALARRDAEAALKLDPAPAVQYQAACVYSLLARQNAVEGTRALELLAEALRCGYGGELVRGDKDLAAIRSLPKYQQLLQAVASLRMEARPSAAWDESD
jgi:tetratricopeptide (TPR) repeat protein